MGVFDKLVAGSGGVEGVSQSPEEVLLGRLRTAFTADQIVRCYRSLLLARKTSTDPKKAGLRVPDHAVRLAALKDYMDRAHGRSAREADAAPAPPATLTDLVTEAARSASFRASLLEMLEKVRAMG